MEIVLGGSSVSSKSSHGLVYIGKMGEKYGIFLEIFFPFKWVASLKNPHETTLVR